MLAKINRIKKEIDFKKIYKFGKKTKGNFFILKYTQTKMPYSRFGFVIPANVIKKAVKRNLLKRRISEAVRLNLRKIKKGYDVVILFFKSPAQDEYQFLEKEILELIKRTEIFKK